MKRGKFVALVLAGFLTACGRSPEHSGGSSDGGGNASQSSPQQVIEAIGNLKSNLHNIVNRVKIFVAAGDMGIFALTNTQNIMTDPRLDTIIEKMRIFPQTADCQSSDPKHREGSANPANLSICLSVGLLVRLPPEALALQLSALGLHEVAHLLGADEFNAQIMQDWILETPRITKLDPEPVKDALLAYSGASSALKQIELIKNPDVQPAIICGDIYQFKSHMDRIYGHTHTPELPSSFERSLSIEEVVEPPIFWVSRECETKEKPTSQRRSEIAAQARRIREILKIEAEKLVEYDSLEKRLAWWIQYM